MSINFIRQKLVFLLSFGLARGALFIAPLLLANWLPSQSYGSIEWAHATASVFATLVMLGVSGAIPLLVLNKLITGTLAGVFAHHISVSLLCLALIVIGWLSNVDKVLLLSASMLVVISLQSLWSVHLKTYGHGEASLILDASLFILIVLTVLVADHFQVVDVLTWIFWALCSYAVCLSCFTVAALLNRLRIGEAIKYQATLLIGMPLMLTILINILIASSGRMAIGIFGGVLLTADYATLARAAAVPIVAHQIILVAKFRDLYALPDDKLERIMLIILSTVLLAVIGLWVASPLLGWVLGAAFVKALNTYSLPGFWILAQAILWSAISLNDTVNARNQTVKKVLPWCVLYVAISIPTAIGLINLIGVSLPHFVYIHGTLMLFFYIVQAYAMFHAGIRLLRVWCLAVGSFLVLILIVSLMHFV